MRILDVLGVVTNYRHQWPGGHVSTCEHSIDYRIMDDQGENRLVRIGFRINQRVYGRPRRRAIVWVGADLDFSNPLAKAFLAADDFDSTGDMLCEMNMPGEKTMCEHPAAVPEAYRDLPRVEYKDRVHAPYVPNAWAVVANIGDHVTMIRFALASKSRELSEEQLLQDTDQPTEAKI